jgi:hypothetical protein
VRFSADSITNTDGKGSPREGRGETRGHCALPASPQFLVALRTGLRLAIANSETNEQEEKLVGSYLYQVHLHHEPEIQQLRPLLSDNDVYIR